MKWLRVDYEDPCPICDHADWCLIAENGLSAICARVAENAARRMGEAGWLHRLDPDVRNREPRPIRAAPDPAPRKSHEELEVLDMGFKAAVDVARLSRLAGRLGLSAEGLRRLGIGWCETSRAWSFPMLDAEGAIRGIRLRTAEGKKFAVQGGSEGLFIPEGLDGSGQLLIAEGPTDTAALLDLGFPVIGRPSCRGGVALLVELLKRLRTTEVAIVADHDRPGQEGARSLASRLAARRGSLRVVAPPENIKDARAWKTAGATPEVVSEVIRSTGAYRIPIRVRTISERTSAPGRLHDR